MDELGRLKIRWALVDDKPERILEILHANTVTNTAICIIVSNLLAIMVSSATNEISFRVNRRVQSYLRSTMGDERLSNLSLMHIHRHVQVDLYMFIDHIVSR